MGSWCLIMEVEELINEVFLEIKSNFAFLELYDSDIYNSIKKVVVKEKIVTKEDVLAKINMFYSKKVVDKILNDNYCAMDNLFEIYSNCSKKDVKKFELLERLQYLFQGVNQDVKTKIYIRLFERYEVLMSTLDEICEECNYFYEKTISNVKDYQMLEIFEIYFKYVNKTSKDDNTSENINCKLDNEVLSEEVELTNHYYKYRDKESRDKLIISNMPLVKTIAKKYIGRGILYEDLVEAGIIGLIKAIDIFDPNKKCRLSSYTFISIERHIKRAINDDSRIIRIPNWRCEELKKYSLERSNFINIHGFLPKPKDMAEILKISLEKAEESELLLSDYVTSLNLVIDDESNVEFGDLLEVNYFQSPEEEIIQSCIKSDINEILEQALTEQERIVIDLAFGGYDGVVRNNEEIGKDMYNLGLYHKPLSRERVRQIREKALQKLRQPSYTKKLRLYL